MRPLEGGGGHDLASHAELVQGATGAACVQLWARVVIQGLTDVEAGLRVLGSDPTDDPDAADSRERVVREARAAAAWLFSPASGRDRAWICGWLGVEPKQLQEAVRREHGSSLEKLL